MPSLSSIKNDPRHEERVRIVQNLYSLFFNDRGTDLPFTRERVRVDLIRKNIKNIDPIIKKYAPRFAIGEIAKIDLAILYLAIFELLIEKKNPPKVVINEAVQLGKEMGSERSYSFINAVLGKIYQIRDEK